MSDEPLLLWQMMFSTVIPRTSRCIDEDLLKSSRIWIPLIPEREGKVLGFVRATNE
jgi:hypothetical protein